MAWPLAALALCLAASTAHASPISSAPNINRMDDASSTAAAWSTYTTWWPSTSSGSTVTVFVTTTVPILAPALTASPSTFSTTPRAIIAATTSQAAGPALVPIQSGQHPATTAAASTTSASSQPSHTTTSIGVVSNPTAASRHQNLINGIIIFAIVFSLALVAAVGYLFWRLRKLRPAEAEWRARLAEQKATHSRDGSSVSSPRKGGAPGSASSTAGVWNSSLSSSSPGAKSPSGLGFVDSIKEKLGRHVSIGRRRSFRNYVPPEHTMPSYLPQSSSTRVLENVAPALPPAWFSNRPAGDKLKSEKHVYPEDRPAWMTHCPFVNNPDKGSLDSTASTSNLLTSDPPTEPVPPKKKKVEVSKPRRLPSGTETRFGRVDSLAPRPRPAPSPPIPPIPAVILPMPDAGPPLVYSEQRDGSEYERVATNSSNEEVSAFDDSPTEPKGKFGEWVKKKVAHKKAGGEEREGGARTEAVERSASPEVPRGQSFLRIE